MRLKAVSNREPTVTNAQSIGSAALACITAIRAIDPHEPQLCSNQLLYRLDAVYCILLPFSEAFHDASCAKRACAKDFPVLHLVCSFPQAAWGSKKLPAVPSSYKRERKIANTAQAQVPPKDMSSLSQSPSSQLCLHGTARTAPGQPVIETNLSRPCCHEALQHRQPFPSDEGPATGCTRRHRSVSF